MKSLFHRIGMAVCLLAMPAAHALSEVSNVTSASPIEESVQLPAMRFNSDKPSVKTVDLTSHHADIWGRVRSGFGMTDLQDPAVDERMRWYLAHPQSLKAMLGRGQKYLFHIVSELEARGMPTELALLPLVESAYNPMALSSAKAAGLWQFIPSTGKDFNLQQNWWVDERRDIVASTNAALQYLQAIYEMHGDWQLALASYNRGEGAVGRAINKNIAAGKSTDYSSLSMPAETRQYVPKLQALKNIIANPAAYGIELPRIPDEPYFTTVERPAGIDIAVAARLAEMSVPEFLSLNPSFNRPVIPGSDDANLILPLDNAQKFAQNLATHSAPLVTWRTYSVPRSERIEDVARRFSLATEALRNANGLPAKARLAAGYVLLVPIAALEQAEHLIREVLPSSKSASNTSRKGTPRR